MAAKIKHSMGERKAKPAIALVIKELREQAMEKSQSQFAAVLKVTKDAVAQWEAGRREPNRWLTDKLYWLARQVGRYDLADKIIPPVKTSMEIAREAFAMEEEELSTTPEKRELGPSPLTRQQRKNLRGQAHTEVDMIFDRAPDQIVKKIMEYLDYYADKFGRAK